MGGEAGGLGKNKDYLSPAEVKLRAKLSNKVYSSTLLSFTVLGRFGTHPGGSVGGWPGGVKIKIKVHLSPA